MLASQLLLTKQDFHTRKHYLNIARLLNEIFAQKNIIPIINENDSVAIEELMFTDNDELAGLIAAQVGADKLVILGSVAGVYTGHPNDPDATLIPLINPDAGWPNISSAKSTHGRGGMISKISTARKMSSLGVTTYIASINEANVVNRIVSGEMIGTVILPARKKSNIKRWIAFDTGKKNGSIVINKCLYEILTENKRVLSILPIGIERYEGNFKRSDVVEILSPKGEKMGVGIAMYDAAKLKEYCGKKNKKAFIHYDHLYLF